MVEKIFLQGVRGIAIVPKWERKDWYWALGQAAVDWVDLPHDIPVFQDDSGTVYPQRGWDTRVVLFDACFAAHDDPHHVFETPNKTITNEGKSCVPPASGVSEGETADTEDSPGLPRRMRRILHRLSLSEDAQRMCTTGVLAHHFRGRLIRSVVGSEAEHEHPLAPEYKRKLLELFPQVFESKTYKDIMDNYLKRGKYGVCKIEEIPGAIPREFGEIRAVGHRHQALRDKIDEFIRKGFIEAVTDAASGWCSRAFLVPKPNGKWRLVIDYRYVNTQIKNYNFTLPVIEDQLIKQSRNHLWTIVDLEDGFHQMPLHEDSKKYTTFSTPFGNFQWNVLPMGIKIAPQAFQRMVADCLQRENDTDFEPYIDDNILNGTPAVDGEICQNTLDLHWERVRRLFQRLHDCYLTVKPDKCHLFRTRVKYCGHILEGGTRRPAKSKVEAITGWTKEMIKTPKQMKGFLGLANWYAIYIKNFAQHAAPLMESLKGKYSEARPQGQKG